MTPRPQSLGEALCVFLAEPSAPFDWAGASCAHWAANWVEHATGLRPALPAFDDVRSALRVIEQAGGIGPAVDQALGVVAQPWAMAQIGDLMLFPSDSLAGTAGVGAVFGVCNGQVAAVRQADGAVVFLPCSAAIASWSLAAVRDVAGVAS